MKSLKKRNLFWPLSCIAAVECIVLVSLSAGVYPSRGEVSSFENLDGISCSGSWEDGITSGSRGNISFVPTLTDGQYSVTGTLDSATPQFSLSFNGSFTCSPPEGSISCDGSVSSGEYTVPVTVQLDQSGESTWTGTATANVSGTEQTLVVNADLSSGNFTIDARIQEPHQQYFGNISCSSEETGEFQQEEDQTQQDQQDQQNQDDNTDTPEQEQDDQAVDDQSPNFSFDGSTTLLTPLGYHYVLPAGRHSIHLQWDPVDEATEYQIVPDGGMQFATIFIHGHDFTDYTIDGLASNSPYHAAVRACRDFGADCSAFTSLAGEIVTEFDNQNVPDTPSFTKTIADGNTRLQWSVPQGTTYFRLNTYPYYSNIYSDSTTSLDVPLSVHDWYQVQACNDNGCSLYSLLIRT